MTTHPKLDRLKRFDPSSLKFNVRSLIRPSEAETPISKDWPISVTLDQGEQGACVGFAFAHTLLATPDPEPGIDADFATQDIYWEAQKIDNIPGGSYPGATPQGDGTDVLDGMQILQKLKYFDNYRWAFSVSDMVLAIGYNGPVVIGINWYEGMDDYNEKTGLAKVTGQVRGGHAIMVRAVDVDKKLFTLHNSWGSDWGINGDCYVSFDDMERLLDDQGECCVPLQKEFQQRHNDAVSVNAAAQP